MPIRLLCFFSLNYVLWVYFLGNSTHSDYIFKLQTRIIRVILEARIRDSCRKLFKILNILPLSSQYIFSLDMFVVNNKGLLMENSELHIIKTRNKSNLYQPSSHLTIYQKGTYCTGIKVYNNLPTLIKMLSCNIKQFKIALESSYEFSTNMFLLYFI
jgi:hypothetical protein